MRTSASPATASTISGSTSMVAGSPSSCLPVVADDHGVGAHLHDLACVVGARDSFHQEWSAPRLAQPAQVVPGHRGIELRVHVVAERNGAVAAARGGVGEVAERDGCSEQSLQYPERVAVVVMQRGAGGLGWDRQPVARARSTDAAVAPRSLHTYSCSHSGPEEAAATSSMLALAAVLSGYTVPARAAARAAGPGRPSKPDDRLPRANLGLRYS